MPLASHDSTHRLFWRRIWQLPETLALQSGAKGELLVAQVRLLISALVLLIPLKSVLTTTYPLANFAGLALAFTALLLALIVYQIVKRGLYRPWLSVATTVLDVSLVSAALATFMVLVSPLAAVNSRVTFDIYLLAIGATGLRHDVRLTLLAGGLAALEYASMVTYAATHFVLTDPVYAPSAHGAFGWNSQVSRMTVLLVGTLLSATVVARTQQLRRLSVIDRLTALYNRAYFDERLEAELSRSRRTGQPLSLVMVDVDHFKCFNDSYGHASGDAGLRALASQMHQMVRRSDIVARYGGEEFVLLLPETSAEAAVEKMEAMCRAISRAAIQLPRAQTASALTISAGIATFPADGLSGDSLLDEADTRLFKAKEEGRNRVVGRVSAPVGASPPGSTSSPTTSPTPRP